MAPARSRVLATLAVALLSATLSACSADPENASDTTSADQQAALRDAVTAYSDAWFSGDDEEAFSLLSQRCIAQVARGQFAVAVRATGRMYGTPRDFTYEATIQGEDARVSRTYDNAVFDSADEPWVFESGHWHLDTCPGTEHDFSP